MYYKRCLRCDLLFSSLRKDGESTGEIQFKSQKYCSKECGARFRAKFNSFNCNGKICRFTTDQGFTYSFDSKFLKEVSKYWWYSDSEGYAMNRKKSIRLHEVVMGKKKGFVIDHVDNNKCNNRALNLRYLTFSQNIHRGKKGCLP